jgi:hypothetical protein
LLWGTSPSAGGRSIAKDLKKAEKQLRKSQMS